MPAAKRSTTPPKRVMTKQSQRGAYKKQVKDQLVLRRAPIVETKQRVHSDIAILNGALPGTPTGAGGSAAQPLNFTPLVVDDAFTLLNLASYYRISHGLEEYQCIGNSLFSKYFNLKLQMRFPDGSNIKLTDATGTYEIPNVMIQKPTKVYLICGWVTRKWGLPLTQMNATNTLTASTASQANLLEYITSQLKPYFDDDEDKLQFRPKQTTSIKIDKYVRIKPNLNEATATQAHPANTWGVPGNPNYDNVVIPASGSIPDVYRSWSVKTNKKLVLSEGVPITAETETDVENLYSNDAWLPFAVIYNPDYEEQVKNWVPVGTPDNRLAKTQMIQYRFNDAHYFTDS